MVAGVNEVAGAAAASGAADVVDFSITEVPLMGTGVGVTDFSRSKGEFEVEDDNSMRVGMGEGEFSVDSFNLAVSFFSKLVMVSGS